MVISEGIVNDGVNSSIIFIVEQIRMFTRVLIKLFSLYNILYYILYKIISYNRITEK